MRNVNYKSDFDFIMRLKDCADDTKTVPFPDCDFEAMFWTSSKTKAYIASCKGGVCTNCFRTKDGDMHFVFDNQHMGLGTLHWEPHFELPNDLYPDSIQDLFRKASLDIKLVDGDGDCPTTAEIEFIAPFIKGDAFTYADFTPEQITELQKPAVDAATEVKATEKAVKDAETLRVEAEKKRVSAEDTRKTSEDSRVSAESSRVSAENKRTESENTRDSNERTRISNENTRIANEQTRKDNELIRQTNEQKRVSAEDERKDSETLRKTSEQSRIGAEELREHSEGLRKSAEDEREASETVRQTEESTRQTDEQTRQTNEQTRQAQEQSRQTAENARADAENARATEFAGFADEIDEAKRAVFDDLWLKAVGTYGSIDHTHVEEDGVERHYYLNELWLTYDEATAVYQAGAIDSTAVAKRYFGAKIRTNLPPVITGQAKGETAFVFECLHIADSSDIEVLNLASSYDSSLYNFKLSPANNKGTDRVFSCSELRAIIGYICLNGSNLSPYRLFGTCPKLEDVRVTAVSSDLDIKSLPKINVASIKFMIEKSSVPNDKTITITVHPDTYRKLTLPLDPDADGYADRDTAWDGLVELAATHKITFATA